MIPEKFPKPCITIHVVVNDILMRSLFPALFLSISLNGFAQNTMEIGFYGGISYYLGDLNPGKHFQHPKIAYGAVARYNIDSRWAVKISGFRGKAEGSSSTSGALEGNMLNFTSSITDISATAEFNFLKYYTGSKRDFISPYIYAGISMFFYNPEWNGYSLRTVGTEGQNEGYDGRKPYGNISFAIPFGLGVKMSLAKNLGMTVFWEMHKTFTDYLDDVSQTYYLNSQDIDPQNMDEVLSDPTLSHQPGMERGNPKTKDWYSFSGITLSYKFKLHGSRKCRDTKF